MRYWLLVAFGLGCLGCGKSFNDGSNNKSFRPVDIRVVQGAEVLSYNVRFVPKDINSPYSVVRHDYLDGQSTEVAIGVTGEFLDYEVKSGRTYRYEIGSFGDVKEFVPIFEQDITIPLDIALSEGQTAEVSARHFLNLQDGYSLLKISRLNLARDSKLFTLGHDLKVKIEELYSDGGFISSFPENSKARKGNPGMSGGNLIVEVISATGRLNLVMRGQVGGDGITPKPYSSDVRGAPGTPGDETGLAYEIETSSISGGGADFPEQSCQRRPAPGGTGGQGIAGKPGNEGLPGGDSGTAMLTVERGINFQVDPLMQPGVGGEGSPGGPGSLGGVGGRSAGEKVIVEYEVNGGPNGSYEYFNEEPVICNFDHGEDGLIGVQGPSGKKGPVGQSENVCIKANSKSEIYCLANN